MEHTVTGQTGGTSTELSQSGCISPSTQRQTQAARDSTVSSVAKTAINNRRTIADLPDILGQDQNTPPIAAHSRQNRPGPCIKTVHALPTETRAGFGPGAGRV